MERGIGFQPLNRPGADSAEIILASWSPGEVRIAVSANDILIDYMIWRPGIPDGVGDLYRGRVTAVVPAMAGAFVTLTGGKSEYGNGSAEGFLPDSEGAKGVTEGSLLIVRITRGAQGGKGPRLSSKVDWLEGGIADKAVGLLRRGIDPLREIASRHSRASVCVDDTALAASLLPDLGDRVIRVATAFDDPVAAEIDGLASPEIRFASGMRLSIHPTAALVAIDVDGGAALAGRDTAARRHLTLNLSVVPDVARQIRLRNLSGAILIDFAGMRAKSRSLLGPALAAALENDPLRPKFLGFTSLGLAEIMRHRVRAPLHEMLMGPHAAGLDALRAIAAASRSNPGTRLALHASPSVIAALESDSVALADIARITGRGLDSRSDPSFPGNGWRIEAIGG